MTETLSFLLIFVGVSLAFLIFFWFAFLRPDYQYDKLKKQLKKEKEAEQYIVMLRELSAKKKIRSTEYWHELVRKDKQSMMLDDYSWLYIRKKLAKKYKTSESNINKICYCKKKLKVKV